VKGNFLLVYVLVLSPITILSSSRTSFLLLRSLHTIIVIFAAEQGG